MARLTIRNDAIAVVGGGIFGVTAAIALAEAGYTVDLYERGPHLMGAASGANQFRLHRGYHYPRSTPTILQSLAGEPRFREVYPASIADNHRAYYVLAAEGSLSDPAAYLRVLDEAGLSYNRSLPPGIRSDMVSLGIEVPEGLIDPVSLREETLERLVDAGVRVHLGVRATPELVSEHAAVVVATYARLNDFLIAAGVRAREYQYEVCEIAVVELPETFADSSVVVMDGPFFCFDPYGRSGKHLWYDVVHSVHYRSVGTTPVVPPEYEGLIDKGVIADPPVTHFSEFRDAAIPFFPELANARYIGSCFTIRSVLPRVDSTDERPSTVELVDDRIVTVFSGKICTAVDAADQVVDLVARMNAPVAAAARRRA